MRYIKDTLKSGLTVVRVPMDSVKSVTVLALVRVGSRYEEVKVSGISHFLEHMVFKGTEKYPTAQDVAVAIDAIGADFNAFTSKEYTGYYVKSAGKDIEIALDVVSDMLLTPRLLTEDIEREKGVIIEEINMYEDSPMRNIGDVFERMFYHGSNLGRDIIGTRETVKGITQKDFQDHLLHWYGLHNVVLMLVGEAALVENESILDRVSTYFSKGDALKRDDTSKHDWTGNPIAQEKRIAVKEKKTEQAHFIMGFPGIKRYDPDRYAVSLLSTILGGNMSSRLFTEVREKRGLCYYVRSDVDTYMDAGFFGAAAGVDPNRVDEAITVTLQEFLDIESGKKAVSADELKRAKDYSIGSLILGMEDSYSIASVYGMRQLLENEIKTLDQVINDISKVTLDDVKKAASRLIKPEEVRFAIIGPFGEQERFEKLLK